MQIYITGDIYDINGGFVDARIRVSLNVYLNPRPSYVPFNALLREIASLTQRWSRNFYNPPKEMI